MARNMVQFQKGSVEPMVAVRVRTANAASLVVAFRRPSGVVGREDFGPGAGIGGAGDRASRRD